MKYKRTIWLLTFLAVIFSLTATASAGTVTDIINDSEDHTILETALNDTGLTAPLSAQDANFTVFAPTDAAFAALPTGLLDSLTEEELTNILLYHALGERVLSTDLSDGMTATTLLGKDVLVTIDGTDVFINNAKVTVVDLEADNGVVHVIDAVLVPPATVVDIISTSPKHTILETALNDTGLTAPLSAEDANFTVFAPTDDAFAALPPGLLGSLTEEELTNILLYHALGERVLSTDLSDGMTATTLLGKDVLVTIDGTDVFINNAKVTVVDLEADNGVVHVIDAVLVPPATVVDIISNSPKHTILETALNDTGLTTPLSAQDANFTVFAPTDAAFAALPPGLLASLTEEELTNILLYHALGERVLSTDLSDGMTATTLLGKNILVTINEDGVFINDAKVTVVDLEADNGVVHVIDAVLVPPNIKADIIALRSQVDSEDLFRPIDRGLEAKLDAALKSVSKGNEKAAANQLNAFINHVESQSGKAIDENVADEWIASAEMIISDLKS